MLLKDKVVVITGASDGIGRETALRLAREGAQLALIARNEEKLQAVERECKNNGSPHVQYYSVDMTDTDKLEEMVKFIVNDFGGIDVLVNIAGVWQKLNYLEDILAEEVDKVLAINLNAVIHTTRLILPYLKEKDEAAIINFASRSGVTAQPGQTIYCASKWGVHGLTEVLKEDLKDTGVRVAAIYAAGIKTGLLDRAGDKINTDEFTDPADIAETICFMLSRPPKIWLHDVRITY